MRQSMDGMRSLRIAAVSLIAGLLVVQSAPAAEQPGLQRFDGSQSIYRTYLQDHLSRVVSPNGRAGYAATARLGALNLAGVELSVDTATGHFRQLDPAVGRFDNGNYLALWRDDQNGTDVLIQRRFDGNLSALGTQTPLFGGGLLRLPTALTMASDGLTLVAGWLDNITGHFTAAFVDSTATVTSAISVNLTASPELIGAPDIGRTYPRGHVAVWEEFQSGGWHIYSQKFDSLGVRQGTNINVDAGSNTPLRLAPAVAGDTAGGFIVTWTQGDNVRSDIWARVFNAAGAAVGAAFAVTSAVATESYITPTATYVASTDEYWLCYIMADPANDSTSLLLRRMDRTGTLVGSETALPAFDYPWNPEAVHTDTAVVIVTTRYDNLADIRALALDAAVNVIDSSEIVNDPVFNTRSNASAIASNDTVLVIWQDRRSGEEDIRGRLRTDAAAAGADLKLNEEVAGGQQLNAAVVTQPAGGVRAAFEDTQVDAGDIAWVSVSESGTVTDRALISDDPTVSAQFDPAAACDSTGRALVVWTDERTDWAGPARHAAGRFVAPSGTPDSGSFELAATSTATSQSETDVAMTLDGRAVVGWIDNRTGLPQAYVRIFDATGTPITGDLVGNDGSIGGLAIAAESAIDVSIDSLDRVWAAWTLQDASSDSFHVLVQGFLADGARRGATIDLSPLGRTAAAVEFSLHALGTGGFRLAWADPDPINRGIWLRDYDVAGTPAGPARRISDSDITAHDPYLWVDQYGRYTVAWSQAAGTDEHIIWQRFHPNDTPVDTLERLSPDTSASRRRHPMIAASQTFLYAVWHDNADAGQGYDVRVSSILYAPAGVGDDMAYRPDQFRLHANYPNPFNPETVIGFYLPTPASAELDIFNVLGQQIRRLDLGMLPAGEHKVNWDGQNTQGAQVGSGVYFYRVTAGNYSATHKMLLLR